jgi:ElaB/YqjD/DUF883 family membrane-anchored ribosome-binding protein
MATTTQDHTREAGISSTMADLKDRAMDQIDKTSSQAGRMAHSVAEQAIEAGQKVQEVASTVDTTVRHSLRDQPMATLAVVAALGFVLGALWKSR